MKNGRILNHEWDDVQLFVNREKVKLLFASKGEKDFVVKSRIGDQQELDKVPTKPC